MSITQIDEFILLLGVVLLAVLSFKTKALTLSGAIASVFVGGVITYGFSLYGLMLLASFFLSSSILGRILVCDEVDIQHFEEKGEKREFSQVLANGGWSAVAAFLFILTDDLMWFFAFVASLSAANSDTWASAIGKQSKNAPRMLLSGEVVSPGQSGGITALGNFGAILGSLFLVIVAYSFQFIHGEISILWWHLLVISLIGFFGQWADALAGAYLQGLYQCSICKSKTEKRYHCQTKTSCIKGETWINNDLVNHICTGSAFLFGAIFGFIIT